MVEVLAFDRLGPGHPRVEVTHRLEELEGDILLRDIDVGQFGAREGRLVVYPSIAGSVGLRTDDHHFQNASVIKPGDRIGLVMGREFLNRQLVQSNGQFDLDLTLKRFSPRNPDPPSKPLRLRVKIVSSRPPDVFADVERVFPVPVDVIDESDETVSIAVVALRNAPAPAPYHGPPVDLIVRAHSDGVPTQLQPAAATLLVRMHQPNGGVATETWIGLDRFAAIALPLDQPVSLEFGLPPAVLRDCLRAGSTANDRLGIPISVVVAEKIGPKGAQKERADASAGSAVHHLTLALQFEGSPGDVFFFKTGNEQFRTILRPGGAPPTRTLARMHTARRRSPGETDLGLAPLVFDVSMLSVRSDWTVEPVANLVDHDAGKHIEKALASVRLSGGLQPIPVPLPEMAAELVTDGCHLEHATLDVRFRLRNRDSETTAGPGEILEMAVEIPVSVEGRLPAWLVCVDFGASAIAVAVARGEELYQMPARGGLLRPLPLGDWFRTVDGFHPEIVASRPAAGQSATSVLLPSYVGLSSSMKLRTMCDPVSYGDFEAMIEDSVPRRLELLGCEYDVSVPYPSYDKLSDELEKIVFAIKRELVKGNDTMQLNSHVHALRSGVLERTTEIGTARLFGDCCRELGGFIVPRTLRYATQPGKVDAAAELRAFQIAMETGADDSVGLVLTHPFGMDAKQLSLYREAGRRFLGGLLGRSPGHDELGRIITVPEALAAARYGLFRLLNSAREQIGERVTIVCLDIGASTYDVTIIDAETRKSRASQPLPDWSIRGHFGILLGGTDLDAAIARRVIEIINAAADTPDITSRFAVERNLKATNARIDTSGDRQLRRKQRHFLDALQRAKKDLTDRLLARPGPYQWTDDFLVVDVGTAALPGSQGDDKPFASLMPELIPARDEAPIRLKIAGEAAELAYGRDAAGTPYVNLLIPPESFRVRRTERQPFARSFDEVSADEVTEVLGRRIPELTAAVAGGSASAAPVWWIVTGRAALWAPLYANIAEIAALNFGRIAEKPYSPTEMKEAVLEGALRLAVEMHLPLTASNPPTIGIVSQSHEGGVPFQPFEGAAQHFDFPGGTPRELVRMLPGLHEVKDPEAVCAAFEAVGLQPWTVLERNIDRPGCARITVEWTRTSGGIEVAVTGDDRPESRRSYGPFREDRIYGQPLV